MQAVTAASPARATRQGTITHGVNDPVQTLPSQTGVKRKTSVLIYKYTMHFFRKRKKLESQEFRRLKGRACLQRCTTEEKKRKRVRQTLQLNRCSAKP